MAQLHRYAPVGSALDGMMFLRALRDRSIVLHEQQTRRPSKVMHPACEEEDFSHDFVFRVRPGSERQ